MWTASAHASRAAAPHMVEPVDTSDIEAWTREVVHRLKACAQLEDRQVELKREWPTHVAGSYTKAARQLAGLANANHPEPVLWLVGIDEQLRQVVGANAVETATWWNGVASCFDGDAPGLADVVVMVDGQTVVALCFDTSAAPFVVKNPLHGSTAGHVIASEVPWRDGTQVRSIRKHELRTLLAPRLTAPKVRAHSAMLTLQEAAGADSQFAPRWSGSMAWTVESLVPKRLTLPVHRMTLQVEIPNYGYAAPVRPQFIDTRQAAYPGGGSDVRFVGEYVIVDGPGVAELMVASFEAASPLPLNAAVSPATLTLTMPAPGLPSPIVITAILAPAAEELPTEIPDWFPPLVPPGAAGRRRVAAPERAPAATAGGPGRPGPAIKAGGMRSPRPRAGGSEQRPVRTTVCDCDRPTRRGTGLRDHADRAVAGSPPERPARGHGA
jgi:hypothetical protein